MNKSIQSAAKLRTRHRACPEKSRKNNRPKIDAKKHRKSIEKSTNNLSKMNQKSIKIEAWEGSGRILAPKRVLGGVWTRKSRQHGSNLGQHGSNLASKVEPKWVKNRSKNRSNFWCLLESIFEWILVDFGKQNGSILAPTSDQKSMLNSKGDFS